MPYVEMVEYENANAEVREIYDEIPHQRGPMDYQSFGKHSPFIHHHFDVTGIRLRTLWRQARSMV